MTLMVILASMPSVPKRLWSRPSFIRRGTPRRVRRPVKIRAEKKLSPSRRRVLPSRAFDSNTKSLLVTKANSTDSTQLRPLLTLTPSPSGPANRA